MLNEDQYMERTPDLIAKVRAMREEAEKEMNRFTRLADYDARRCIGQKPADAVAPDAAQAAIELAPEPDNDGEAQP